MNKRTIEYLVSELESGSQIKYILRWRGVSSKLLTKLKSKENGILLNGKHAAVIETAFKNDRLTINIDEDVNPAAPENLNVEVIYEDKDIIAFNKPAGMPVHPSKNLQSGTLANEYAYRMQLIGRQDAFRPINRLDRGTSGIVVAAKHRLAASKLSGNIEKEYVCICRGVPDQSGTVDAPIKRAEDSKMRRIVSPDGQRAVTHYKRLSTDGESSLMRVVIETGRTHQIRVHFAYIGHPLVGDTLYGIADEKISRQALHCIKVIFMHPVENKLMNLYTDLPCDMQKYAEYVDKYTEI